MPESRSLSELTRQIAPPTKNGHAPPPTESRKSYQSVNPVRVRAGICYWQDQPGRGKRARRRGAGRAGGGGVVGRGRPPRGEGAERGGGGREGRSPGRETRPPRSRPRRGRPTARPTLGVREGRGASPPPRGRHEGGGGVVRRGGGRRAALLSPSSIPPGPGHTGDGRRAPSASVRPPAPERGGGRRAARTRRPARGGARPGTRPALGRAHRGGGAPSSGTRRRRRRRRRRHGRRIGAAAGPGSEAHQGTRPRGAADGEGTEADGRAERGTDGMRPRGADTAQPAAGVGWPRATARGTAQSEPGEGTRVGRRGPPRDLTATGPPGTGAVPRRHPRRRTGAPTLAGLAATATATPGAAAGPGRTLSRRTPAAPPPHGPHARGAPPPRPPRSGLSEGTAPLRPGTPPARQGPGDDTHVKARRGRLGPGQGTGTRAVARAGRGEARRGRRRRGGAGEHARRGPRDRDAGAVRGPEEKDRATRPGPQEHQRGIPPPPAREGGPATPGAPAGPGHPRSVARDPAPPPGPASLRLSLNPEARPPGDDALERGGPDRDRTPPPAAAQGARAGLTPRGPAARTRPPTCRTPGGAQRDPPPTRRGEARAAGGPPEPCPGHLSPTLPHKHQAPSSLGGGGGVSSGRPGGGEGRVVAKAGARTPREGEPAEDALPASSTRVGVPVRPSLRTGIWLRRAKGTQKTEPSARRFPRDERAPTRERARGPDRPRRGTQDGPSRSPPPDRDAGSRRGVSQSRVRRPRPTRARWRVERALPGHPREQGPVHPRLRTRQDLDREKARVPRDASGDRTPRGDRTRASPGPPSGPHLRSATRKTPRAERTRGPGPRRALRRPPSHRPGRSPPPERGRRRSKRS
ncbi:hypothetical protein ABFV05_004744 [Capra hircus]